MSAEIIAAIRDTETPRFVGIMTIGTEIGIEPMEIGMTTGSLNAATAPEVGNESDPHGPSTTMMINGAGALLDLMTTMASTLGTAHGIANGITATITAKGETMITVMRWTRHPIVTGCLHPGLPGRTVRQVAGRRR